MRVVGSGEKDCRSWKRQCGNDDGRLSRDCGLRRVSVVEEVEEGEGNGKEGDGIAGA